MNGRAAFLLALLGGAAIWTGCSSSRPAVSTSLAGDPRVGPPDLLRIRRQLDSGIELQTKGRYAHSQAKLSAALSELSLSDTSGLYKEPVEGLTQQILGAMKNNLPYSLDPQTSEDAEAYEEDGLALIDSLLPDSAGGATLDSASAERMWREIQGDTAATYDLPVEVNDMVLLHLRTFQERLPQHFARWLERKGRWESMITQELAAHGLPRDLLYLAMIESGFNPRATSPAAAAGIWQFIPATGRRFGLRIDRFVDERRDPWKSTQAAIQYLSTLYQMFGDWRLAMASYNCGEACVGRSIRRTGNSDFWTLSLPRETKNYVPRVFAAAILGKNPKAHGFDVTPWDPVVSDTFTVEGGLTFAQIGDALGVPADSIAVLNPELTRGTTPPLKGEWVVHLPAGSRDRFAAVEPNLERSFQAPQPQKFTYRTRRRESLSSIAARYGVTVADLKRWNRIGGRKVRAGRHLVIWGDAPTVGVAVREPPLREQGDGIPERTGWKLKSHKVRRGENLSSIARRYGVTTEQLVSWNGLSSNRLKAGKRIYVSSPSEGRFEPAPVVVAKVAAPAGKPLQALTEAELMDDGPSETVDRGAEPAGSARPTYHRVRHGETLTGLAARFGVEVSDLRAWNRLQSDVLRPGVRLRVQGSTTGDVAAAKPAKPARIVRLSADPDDNPLVRTHRVEPGETLESIARQYGVAISSLKILNRLRNSRIVAGRTLSIPVAAGRRESSLESAPSAPPPRIAADRPPTVRYVVREGDSLYSIARERSTTVDTLMSLNGLQTSGIRAGQVIEVPMVASR